MIQERAAEIAKLVEILLKQLRKYAKAIDFEAVKKLPYMMYNGVKNVAGKMGGISGAVRQMISGKLELPGTRGIYDAYHVTRMMNIDMQTLKKHPNTTIVNHVLNNNLNQLQLLYVVYQLQNQPQSARLKF